MLIIKLKYKSFSYLLLYYYSHQIDQMNLKTLLDNHSTIYLLYGNNETRRFDIITYNVSPETETELFNDIIIHKPFIVKEIKTFPANQPAGTLKELFKMVPLQSDIHFICTSRDPIYTITFTRNIYTHVSDGENYMLNEIQKYDRAMVEPIYSWSDLTNSFLPY